VESKELEEMHLEDSVEALSDMEPALAARHFSRVQADQTIEKARTEAEAILAAARTVDDAAVIEGEPERPTADSF
jgi:hypothetical protein